jgi:hypothetical protein
MPTEIGNGVVMFLCCYCMVIKFINPKYGVIYFTGSHHNFLPTLIVYGLFKKSLFPHTPYTLNIIYISIFIFHMGVHMGLHMGVHMGLFLFRVRKVVMPTFYKFLALFCFNLHAVVPIKPICF